MAARLLAFVVFALIAAGSLSPAEACTVGGSDPPPRFCALRFYPVIFIGRTIGWDESTESYRVEVIEAFKGLRSNERIVSIPHGSTCDAEFRGSARYLINAFRHPNGQLYSGIGDYVRESEMRPGQLADLRELRRGIGRTQVAGTITRAVTRTETQPLGGARVTVTGQGRTFNAKTDAKGRFEVDVRKPGS